MEEQINIDSEDTTAQGSKIGELEGSISGNGSGDQGNRQPKIVQCYVSLSGSWSLGFSCNSSLQSAEIGTFSRHKTYLESFSLALTLCKECVIRRQARETPETSGILTWILMRRVKRTGFSGPVCLVPSY